MRSVLFRWSAAVALLMAAIPMPAMAERKNPLDVGVAGHAFDHLNGINEQAEAAAASGSTIIYATGFGQIASEGLPKSAQMESMRGEISAYARRAKTSGIRLVFGYVCGTSIVRLPTFDQNWTPEFRSQFSSAPIAWLQQDRDGKPLPSWYGGDYRPACMNNPDWRTYEKFVLRQQLEAGLDGGILFDNPTVHPHGCYCEHCMKKFGQFLTDNGDEIGAPASDPVGHLRKLAVSRSDDFMRFRSITARDFLAEMRRFARTIKPEALITCNNSMNTPESLFSQCRAMGYNIYELSKAQDFVLVEDMATLSRMLPNGAVVEFGPMYGVLLGISRGKPVVAMTIADGDYHTPANLTRLGMAEAAAHGASYLTWPTWPENVRQRMIAEVRPEADVLRKNAELLNGRNRRADAVVFLPFRRWVETADCPGARTARALGAANVQFEVVCEDDLEQRLTVNPPQALIIESTSVLLAPERQLIEKYEAGGGKVISTEDDNWFKALQGAVQPSLRVLEAPPTVRVIVHDQSKRTIVHLLNLDVQRISSFEDRVKPAANVRLQVRVPRANVQSVRALSADAASTKGDVPFAVDSSSGEPVVDLKVPDLEIATMLVIE